MSMYKLKVANVMGLDANNSQYGLLIMEVLDGVNDADDFIDYLRTRKEGVEYANRIEKLDGLAYQYKRSDRNLPKEVQGMLPKYCNSIVDKFSQSIQILEDNEEVFEGHLSRLKVSGTQWFMNKEISSLEAIGSLRKCISLYKENSLYEKLYEVSIKRYLVSKTESLLTDGQKRVKLI